MAIGRGLEMSGRFSGLRWQMYRFLMTNSCGKPKKMATVCFLGETVEDVGSGCVCLACLTCILKRAQG